MPEMVDGDWNLGYSATKLHPGADLLFGRQPSGIYCLSEPEVSFSDADKGDGDLPGEDGIRMGRDYQRSATVTFELGVDGVDRAVDGHGDDRPWAGGSLIGVWPYATRPPGLPGGGNSAPTVREPYRWSADGVDMLRQAWRADSVRDRAGGVAWLRHTTVGGRTRMLYGRPRKFAVGHSRLTRQGYTPVVCDFVSIDDRFYDATESAQDLWGLRWVGVPGRPGRPADAGPGVTDSKTTAVIKQKGRVATHPYVRVYGPCKNPKVTLVGVWEAQLSLELKSTSEYVQIDPRPFARSVMHYKSGSSSSVADKLTRSSPRLAEMVIPPGQWTAKLAYTNAAVTTTTGPRVEIRWRDAYTWW
ncbi:hypothetical protein ABZ687_28775 [Streptomyces ardesiacus]|uniref:hypothetical protein n=1 Tax=Streptomyces ardesiacus TaxID=285564 RepID=UPI0033C84A57